MNALWDAVATYRLTRLVTADTILDRPREAVIRFAYQRADNDLTGESDSPTPWADLVTEDDNPPKLATLVTCRWCAGMWLATAVVAARHLFPRAWTPVARVLTYSAGAALLARLEDE